MLGTRVHKPEPAMRWSIFLIDIVWFLVLAGVSSIVGALLPTRRSFFVTPGDPALSFPVVPDIIPTWANVLMSIIGPLVLMPLVAFITAIYFARAVPWIAELRGAWLGILFSHAYAGLVTGVIKNVVGRPRPTLLSVVDPGDGEYRSFPSGHTMTAFVGFTYLTLYVMAKTHVMGSYTSTRLFWTTVALLLMSPAIVVGVSRYYD